MRPGRLREIFDDAGNVVVAFDQQHVAGLQHRAQRIRLARRERLVAVLRLFQIAGKKLPDAFECPTHRHRVPGRAIVLMRGFFDANLMRTHCNLVHRDAERRYQILAMKIAACRAFGQCRGLSSNHSDTMPGISRRSFLAASAALTAVPARNFALGAVPASGEVDILIVGAGAAGIAAARRIAAANRRFALVEASDHIGGRCVTDTRAFGVPFDRGAHWVHKPDSNPLARLAAGTGLEIYPAPRAQILRVPPRLARDAEMEQYFSALVRSQPRHRRRRSRPAAMSRRHARCRAISATGNPASNSRSGPTAPARICRKSPQWILAAPASAKPTHSAARAMARCWRNLQRGLPVQLSTPVSRARLG